MSFYQYSARLINGDVKKMSDYEGKIIIVVNTASNCGFTPQFEQLESLYRKYNEQGFEILGFPCNQFGNQDPGSNEEIHHFCSINYQVTFPMFEKIEVNGEGTHPIYQYLKSHATGVLGSKNIKWNFTKFLIDKNGEVVSRYAPTSNPLKMEGEIEKLLLQ